LNDNLILLLIDIVKKNNNIYNKDEWIELYREIELEEIFLIKIKNKKKLNLSKLN